MGEEGHRGFNPTNKSVTIMAVVATKTKKYWRAAVKILCRPCLFYVLSLNSVLTATSAPSAWGKPLTMIDRNGFACFVPNRCFSLPSHPFSGRASPCFFTSFFVQKISGKCASHHRPQTRN